MKKDFLCCPICYEFIDEPVECLNCCRLFCLYCYNKCVSANTESCPLCKDDEWEVKEDIHIVYKQLFEDLLYDCGLCPLKDLKKKELRTHVELCHNKTLKEEKGEYYDYTLVDEEGKLIKELDHLQNLELNLKRLDDRVKLLDENYEFLGIDLKEKIFESGIGGVKGNVYLKKSVTISRGNTYDVWGYGSDEHDNSFLFEKHQHWLNKEYKIYLANSNKFETYVDFWNRRFRINFQEMTMRNINPNSQKYPLQRLKYDL